MSWERDYYVVGTRSYVVGTSRENEIIISWERAKYYFSHVPSVLPYISIHLGLFLKDKIQNWNIFGGLKISNIFFLVC